MGYAIVEPTNEELIEESRGLFLFDLKNNPTNKDRYDRDCSNAKMAAMMLYGSPEPIAQKLIKILINVSGQDAKDVLDYICDEWANLNEEKILFR